MSINQYHCLSGIKELYRMYIDFASSNRLSGFIIYCRQLRFSLIFCNIQLTSKGQDKYADKSGAHLNGGANYGRIE